MADEARGAEPVAATSAAPARRGALWLGLAIGLPLGLLALLRWRPSLDVVWDNNPAHFWLVLAAAAVAATLASSVTRAARQRRDARLLLVSLTFLATAGFLGLHALATPGVLVGTNAGFALATPVGLVIGSFFAAASAIEFTGATNRRVMARTDALLAGLVGLMLLWLVASLTGFAPLDAALPTEELRGWQLAFAGLGVVGYALGAWGWLHLYRRRPVGIVLALAAAFALLAVSLVVVAVALVWHVSWWEWHVLMLVAFGLISMAARQEWHEERFSALYLERTLRGTTEASILFADLASFTPYAERTDPVDVRHMLATYFSRLIPLLEDHGGDVHQLIGDAVMVVFNRHGDQPDHARLAGHAALAFQEEASRVAAEHPEWPRFRVGVNSGEVATGVVGERGHRIHGLVGDTVNLAARLESNAPVGGVLIGEQTRQGLPEGATVEELPPLQVKGKAAPVRACLLHELPG